MVILQFPFIFKYIIFQLLLVSIMFIMVLSHYKYIVIMYFLTLFLL